MAETSRISGLSEIADRYDGFIFDVWGTLYDGGAVYPGALEVLARLYEAGKAISILSNSPQIPSVVEKRLEGLGIPEDHRRIVVTSGLETREHLEKRPDDFYQSLGSRVYETGPDRFPDLTPGLSFERVESASKADFILNAGPNQARETVSDYETEIKIGISLGLPMICANPDRIVHAKGEVHICAGLLADRYIELGGFVRYHGKPEVSVFERCAKEMSTGINATLMVGDNMATDVAGSYALGMDCLLLDDGIHRDVLLVDPEGIGLEHLTGQYECRPLWQARSLSWR